MTSFIAKFSDDSIYSEIFRLKTINIYKNPGKPKHRPTMCTYKGWLNVMSTVLGHSVGKTISAAGSPLAPPYFLTLKHQLRVASFMWLIKTMGICGLKVLYTAFTRVGLGNKISLVFFSAIIFLKLFFSILS